MEPDSKRVINVLQAGRAIAAVAVVVHHAATAARDFVDPALAWLSILRTGRFGVDFFFVLSGFIIYHSTVEKGRGPGDYAWARFRRLYLPYWPAGIGLALLYVVLPEISHADRDWQWLPTLTLFPAGNSALSLAWTLQHEALFYALFGLLFFGRLLWPGLALWAVAIVALPNGSIPLATINLEFLMGIGTALLYRRGIGHWLLLPAAAGLVCLWAWQDTGADNSLLIGLACACAILPLSLMERDGAIKVPRWLVFLGAASYALYLVHSVVISAVARIVPPSVPAILAAGTAASIAAGIAYYRLVERPLLRLAERWPGYPPRR